MGYVLAGAPPQTPRIDTSPSVGPATRFGLFLSSGIRYWYSAAADGQSYRADTAVSSERWYSYEAAASRIPYVTGTRSNKIDYHHYPEHPVPHVFVVGHEWISGTAAGIFYHESEASWYWVGMKIHDMYHVLSTRRLRHDYHYGTHRPTGTDGVMTGSCWTNSADYGTNVDGLFTWCNGLDVPDLVNGKLWWMKLGTRLLSKLDYHAWSGVSNLITGGFWPVNYNGSYGVSGIFYNEHTGYSTTQDRMYTCGTRACA